ncbi:hypothetical protein BJ508DRAFT_417990 [Ascobolus immersus RN42]|uniref:A to I editase domain-containing protein n=1 Tax=Ascobolus immersus RN42 TaxID=1160509 RepID=A0A3N4I1F7_ASCIM|nr:hypothetical protein BJ508DRAFT_417990 [Ascobolus immersus RN42]
MPALPLSTPPSSSRLARNIHSLVLETYQKLPSKCKPQLPHQWTVLSSIILRLPSSSASPDSEKDILECASLATGTRALPANLLPQAQGVVLHDCHAEILAVRGWNRFLLGECRRLVETGSSRILEHVSDEANRGLGRKVRIKENIELWLFTSAAPCGDASMDLQVRLSTTGGEAWTSQPDTAPGEPLRGHAHYSHLGYVRLKPGRSDSLPSNSRCCSDKLCVRQLLGSLLAVTEVVIGKGTDGQGYLRGIVTPNSEYIDEGWQRAFYARVDDMAKDATIEDKENDGGYNFRPVSFEVCDELPAPLVRPSPEGNTGGQIKPAPVSAVFIPNCYPAAITETLVNGVKQGHKRFGGTGASCLSKLSIWGEALDIARLLDDEEGHKQLQEGGYDSKSLPRLEGRIQAKDIMKKSLKNWGT